MYLYLFTFIVAAGLVEVSGIFNASRVGKWVSHFLATHPNVAVYFNASRVDKLVSGLFCGLAVVLLCSLAGARDITIGTDTSGYGLFLYNQGLASANLFDFIQACEESKWDINFLYAFGSYIVVKIFKSQFFYFFAVEFCILVPVLLSILRSTKKYRGLILLVYLLVFYIPGLNLMRQSVAMGFVLLGVLSVVHSNYLRGAIQLTIAVMLHTSALIGIVFCAIWFVAFKRDAVSSKLTYRKRARLILLLLFFGVSLGIVFYPMIAPYFSGFASYEGLGRIVMYATNISKGEAGFGGLVTSLLIICSAFAFRSRIVNEELRVIATFCCLLITMSLPFHLISDYNEVISRMNNYCQLFIVPLLGLHLGSKSSSTLVGAVSLFLFICLKFFYGYVWRGFHEAVPYMSTLLGIG